MIRSITLPTALLGDDQSPPEEVNIPGQVDQGAVDAAAETARRQRVMVIGGIAVLAVVALGSLALVAVTGESRSSLAHRPLRAGQHRCISHIRYRVVNDYGRLNKIGTC